MYVQFDLMPKDSRVWIYQADRKLGPNEVEWLSKCSNIFCEQWSAHGQELKTSYKVFYDQFLILTVDEEASLPSGCSIDSSVHLINQAQDKIGVSFFDRLKVAFMEDDDVITNPLAEIKTKIALGEISKSTSTFNNLVSTIGELETNWKVPVGESWLAKYFA